MADLKSELEREGTMTQVSVKEHLGDRPSHGVSDSGPMSFPLWGTGEEACLHSSRDPRVTEGGFIGQELDK
jgi:hypothetical protein